MDIYSLGIDYTSGEPIFSSQAEEQFSRSLVTNYFPAPSSSGETRTVFRNAAEVQRERTLDQGNPLISGWTMLVNRDDPRCDDYLRVMRPLALRRGMKNPALPLFFDGSSSEDWPKWLLDNYVEDPPLYILVIGDPVQVPFRFQSFLDASAAVGRLDFDNLDDLAAYVEKIIALEDAPAPVVKRQALFFAPDAGRLDATYFSRRFMAEPLAELTEKSLGFEVKRIFRQDATRIHLQESLNEARPALVLTAGHGLGANREPLEIQQKLNGAIVCQPENGQPLRQRLFSAADIPSGEPFLEGTVFFQFACFGYGTPARSDFAIWDAKFPAQNAPLDFTSALPRSLLAHPRGPIAYLGHIDAAFLLGFNDPDDPDLKDRWNPRLKPFVEAVTSLLNVQPVGLALQNMNMRFNYLNASLVNTFEKSFGSGSGLPSELLTRLASTYIFRNDAQNYMVFGDPAARLRIPALQA